MLSEGHTGRGQAYARFEFAGLVSGNLGDLECLPEMTGGHCESPPRHADESEPMQPFHFTDGVVDSAGGSQRVAQKCGRVRVVAVHPSGVAQAQQRFELVDTAVDGAGDVQGLVEAFRGEVELIQQPVHCAEAQQGVKLCLAISCVTGSHESVVMKGLGVAVSAKTAKMPVYHCR